MEKEGNVEMEHVLKANTLHLEWERIELCKQCPPEPLVPFNSSIAEFCS